MKSSTPGQRLMDGRKRKNKSREQVAQEIHRSVSTVKSWELDKAVPRSFQDIKAVCKSCGISVQEYIVGELTIEAQSPYEQRLLAAFFRHTPENQLAILRFMEAMS